MKTERERHKEILSHYKYWQEEGALDAMHEAVTDALESAAHKVETNGHTVNAYHHISPACDGCVQDIKRLECE